MSELERPHNQDESISKLHHMSTTAGMGAGDYVEINPMAIASVALALLSLWGIAFTPFLLLGALGLLAGAFSLIKIHYSNGTQGGKMIAGVGILLSLAISGGEGGRQYIQYAKTERDSQAMRLVAQQLGQALVKKDMVKARNLFCEGFKQIVSQEQFNEILAGIYQINTFGEFQGMEANGPCKFAMSGDGVKMGATVISLRFEQKVMELTTMYALADEQGNWQLYNLTDVFNTVPKLQF